MALDPAHQKAREKLGGEGARGTTSPSQDQTPSKSPATEFTLPRTEEELEAYERTIRRKALIDARADYNAQLKGLPGWVKALMVVVTLMVVAIFAWVVVGFFTVL